MQQVVFPEHQEILYPGRRWKSDELSLYFLSNQFTHPLQYDAESMREKFYGAIESYTEKQRVDASRKKAMVISHESLHSGPEWFGSEFVMMAERIKKVFPEARIIIGIRNQAEYIESNYKEYIVHGGKLSFRYFINSSYGFNYGLKSKLMFDQAISLYHKLFGKEHVHVYLLEDFKLNLENELNRICAFIGVDKPSSYKKEMVNVGLGKNSTSLLRMLNCMLAKDFNEQYYRWQQRQLDDSEKLRWFVVRALRKLESYGQNKPVSLYNSDLKSQVQQMFSASNARLSALLQRDLKQEGYL